MSGKNLKFDSSYNSRLFNNNADTTNTNSLDDFESRMLQWDMILQNRDAVMGNNSNNNIVSSSPNNSGNLGDPYIQESDPNVYQRSGDWHNYQIPNRTATFRDKESDEIIYSDRQYGPLNRLFRFGSMKKQTEDEFYADEERSWNAQLAERNASNNITTEPPKITEPVDNQINNSELSENKTETLNFDQQDEAWYKHQNGLPLSPIEQTYINSLNAPSDNDPTKTKLGEDILQPFDAKSFDPMAKNHPGHIKEMQRVLGIEQDGKWGPQSQAAYDKWLYDQKGFFQKNRQERKDDGSWYLGKKFDEMKAKKKEREYDKKFSPNLVEDDEAGESYETPNTYFEGESVEDPPVDYSGETEATIDDIEGTSSDEFTDPKDIRQANRRDRRIARQNRRRQRRLDRIDARNKRRNARKYETVYDDETGESYERLKERDGFFSEAGKARRKARRLARKNKKLSDDEFYKTSSDPVLDPDGETVVTDKDLRKMDKEMNPGFLRKAWRNLFKGKDKPGRTAAEKLAFEREQNKHLYDADNVRLIEDELSETSFEEPTGESQTIYDDTNQESYEETVPFEKKEEEYLDPDGVSQDEWMENAKELVPDDYYEGESVEESFDDNYYEGESSDDTYYEGESVEPGPDGGYTLDDYGNRVSEEDFYGGTSQENFDDYNYYEGESVEDPSLLGGPLGDAVNQQNKKDSLDSPLDLTSQGFEVDLSKGFPKNLKLKTGQVVLWNGKKMKYVGPNDAAMLGVTPGGRGNKKMWEEVK